jgi:hypothetical protein
MKRAKEAPTKMACGLVTIDQPAGEKTEHDAVMKTKKDLSLAVRCPTCGATPGEKCELSTGQPRTAPHPDRRLEIRKDSCSSEAI